MIASLRELIKKMRSRRLAVWLLAASAVWSFLGTVVPQTGRDAAGAQAWALEHPLLETIVDFLGLHHAFGAPIFLAVVAVLAVSTSLCAWERTVWAGRTLSRTRSGVVPRAAIEQHAHIIIAVPSVLDLGAAEDAVRVALRRMRLRVSSVDGVIEGGSRRWSVFGSPAFHWSLALLMIVIGLGQLTRSEGLMGVPEKEIVLDTAESYGVLTEGPWFTGHSGYGIGITEFERDYFDGTVDRGASPVVTLYDGDLELVSQRIYPNQPLRYEAMMIHMSEWGYAPEVGSTTAAGEPLGSLKMIMDVEEGMPRSTASGFDITSPMDGSTLEFNAALIAHEDGPQLELVGSDLNGEEVARAQLKVGEALTLPNGDRVEYRELHYYARLSVVHDWSVPFIYLLFVLGLAGVSVAVLDPHRRVAVIVGESQDEPNALAVRVLIRHGRRSALFVERVNEVIEASLSAASEDVSTERDRS